MNKLTCPNSSFTSNYDQSEGFGSISVPYEPLEGSEHSGITRFKSVSSADSNEEGNSQSQSKRSKTTLKVAKIALKAAMFASIFPAALYSPYYFANRRVKSLKKKQEEIKGVEMKFKESVNKRIRHNYHLSRENEALKGENRLLLDYIKDLKEEGLEPPEVKEEDWEGPLVPQRSVPEAPETQNEEKQKRALPRFLPLQKKIRRIEQGIAQMEKQMKNILYFALDTYEATENLERENETIRQANRSLRSYIMEVEKGLAN